MTTTSTPTMTNSTRPGSAIGPMVLTFFGAVWIEGWNLVANKNSPIVLAVIVGVVLMLMTLALRRYRALRFANVAEIDTPATRRRNRLFHLANGGQWFVILVLSNVFNNVGLSDWVMPMAIFVIGLHFVPLAVAFDNRGNYVVGALMMLLALVYPFVLPMGPTDALGWLGAGLILWSGAVNGLVRLGGVAARLANA